MTRHFDAPRLAAIIGLSAILLPAAHAGALEDFEALDALTAMVAASAGRTAVPIDRRIKLARCPEAVSVGVADRDNLVVRCASIGWRLRVPLAAARAATGDSVGTAATAVPATAPQKAAIRRGDRVRLDIRTESFSVSYSATAIDDAAVGDRVRLRTADAKAPLLAIATGPGRAQLAD
jgi:flagellar basal body P-ring formation protein FlgA